jgi:hypothetical protein
VLPELWRTLISKAAGQIDILVYAAVFLPEQHVDLLELLRAKAGGGCPDSYCIRRSRQR